MAAALDDLTGLLTRLIGENIDLDIAAGSATHFIRIDPGQFDQVIINLVVNSRDAMRGGGTVRIDTQAVGLENSLQKGHEVMPAGAYVLITVTDTGAGIAKEDIGLRDDQKIRPGGHESMCNPVSQAELLNRAGCQFNLVMGLCIGHDSLFIKHSEGLVSVLVTKDRVLAHNPIGALHLADTYFDRVWGPERPKKQPKLPAGGRK